MQPQQQQPLQQQQQPSQLQAQQQPTHQQQQQPFAQQQPQAPAQQGYQEHSRGSTPGRTSLVGCLLPCPALPCFVWPGSASTALHLCSARMWGTPVKCRPQKQSKIQTSDTHSATDALASEPGMTQTFDEHCYSFTKACMTHMIRPDPGSDQVYDVFLIILLAVLQASTYATPGHSRSSTPGPAYPDAQPAGGFTSQEPTPPPRQTHAAGQRLT